MTTFLSPLPIQRFTDNAGAPLVGGKLFTYLAGTSTKAATYTDSTGITQNPNPIILNGRGEAPVWLPPGKNYKFVLAPSTDSDPPATPIWTVDNIVGSGGGGTIAVITGAINDGNGGSPTDNSTVINAAISSLSAAGGGTLCFPFPGVYQHNSTITLASNVVLMLYGVELKWGGGASSQVTTPNTGYLSKAGIFGGTLNAGSAASKILELYSTYQCSFRDVTLKSSSATNIALDLLINTTGPNNPDGNHNNVFNEFSNILQEGSCGTALRLMGQGPVNGPPIAVVTLNTFTNFNTRGATVRGIDFAAWADSNFFAGITRVILIANNGVGVIYNSFDPTNNIGVYANNFDHLAVDTFGAMTGRVALKMNFTKLNKIDYFFNDPPAEGGAYQVDPVNTLSYYIQHQLGLSSSTVARTKLFYLQGQDNPILAIAGTQINGETVGIQLGINRAASGFATIDMVGDTTYNAYGLRLIRENSGPNANSLIRHRGTGNLQMFAEDVGGQVIMLTQNGVKFVASNTGIGFNGAAAQPAPSAYGTPTNLSKVLSLPGTAATLGQVGGTLAALIADLKAIGLLAA